MKDNLAFAFVLVVMLLGIVSAWSLNFTGPAGENTLGQLIARAFANLAPQEIRYIEPITVIGRRESLAEESLASTQPDDAGASPVKPNQPMQ